MFKRNMGIIDRLVRTAIAIAIVILYLAHQITGMAAAILGVLAVIFLLTSSVGFCPVYKLIGVSSLSKEECGKPGAEECAVKGA